jgi:hypothetical protein
VPDIPAAPEVARRIADALELNRIPYAIGGAIAYGLHAPPRATNDVDLNVFVEPCDLGPVFDAIEGVGAVVDRDAAQRSAVDRGDFIARFQGMRIDVFVLSIPLSGSAAKRIVQGVLLGRPIAVLSAEDLVLFKLLFFRAKDISDIQRLVAFQGESLDHGYIRRWLVDTVGEGDERVSTWDALTAAG